MLSPALRLFFQALFVIYICWTSIAAIVIARRPAKEDAGGAKQHPWRWVVAALPVVNLFTGAIFFWAHRKDNRVWIPAALYTVLLVGGEAAALGFIGSPPEVRVETERRRLARDWRVHPGPPSADNSPDPQLCVAMSGGGIRSAAFSMGVLSGLHKLELLQRVDVVSAVSGGTYTLSWLVLQPFYATRAPAARAPADIVKEMFDRDGPFQKALERKSNLTPVVQLGVWSVLGASLYQLSRALTWLDPTGSNLHGPRMMYRGNIQAAFQQTPAGDNVTRPEAQTSTFWFVNDVPFPELAKFLAGSGLPFPVFNATLRVDAEHRRTMWATVFEITPHGMGADSYDFVRWDDSRLTAVDFSAIRSTNVAPAISGAAISAALQPTSDWLRRAVDYLNLDLGYLLPGFTTNGAAPIYLSDGGHSENLGVYSLLRRRCRAMVVIDGEEESCARANAERTPPDVSCVDKAQRPIRYRFDSLDRLIERLPAEEPTTTFSLDRASFNARRPVLEGTVAYEGAPAPSVPNVLYVKLAADREQLDGYPAEAATLKAFARRDPVFPYDPTTNQRFDGARFAAYRDLGYWLVLENRTSFETLRPRPPG